ncbi:MAG: HD domain-containing protein [Gemmatimonadetes bacterium]|nr:HD domain-containing protein [Gemmatimonadota bacterium]NIR80498.1 HD domain-containing protein [Gemmatimonadota bacterium]NIT89259.1 HD domain-containing protein [Gemmatimonadota bacterium]NIU33058.1 HD domain-containing protein [Gemmatimonadota bacterium]NIU37439.1 HD domain-containing protein [Gemmatimonadota bacterium]
MNSDELRGTLEFLRAAERLKDVSRTSWTSRGARESVAEHTWRLCLMAVVLERELPELDFARLLKICVVHDLGEAIGGDISAPEQPEEGKAADEREDLVRLLEPLPDEVRSEILSLWDEYEGARTAEARIAKALDKLETILQHNQGENPPDFDYGFNLEYGREYTAGEPLIEAIRDALDRETREREARGRESP